MSRGHHGQLGEGGEAQPTGCVCRAHEETAQVQRKAQAEGLALQARLREQMGGERC